MNDDFLFNNRPPMRKEFADHLYQRLQQDSRTIYPRKGFFLVKHSVLPCQIWKYALLSLLILTAIVFTFSEPVRAETFEWLKSVVGFAVEEKSQPDQVPVNSDGEVLVTVHPIPTLSLPESLKNPPFEFALPTWVPEGYVIDQNVAIGQLNDYVIMIWHNPGHPDIRMLVEDGPVIETVIQVGDNSTEEISINGQPALLVRGRWDYHNQWDSKGGIAIGWIKNDVRYRLIINSRLDGDTGAIEEELIRMAESIP